MEKQQKTITRVKSQTLSRYAARPGNMPKSRHNNTRRRRDEHLPTMSLHLSDNSPVVGVVAGCSIPPPLSSLCGLSTRLSFWPKSATKHLQLFFVECLSHAGATAPAQTEHSLLWSTSGSYRALDGCGALQRRRARATVELAEVDVRAPGSMLLSNSRTVLSLLLHRHQHGTSSDVHFPVGKAKRCGFLAAIYGRCTVGHSAEF